MTVTTILVTYNSAAVICDALDSLRTQSEISRIVVVDNASSDDTCALVTKRFPHVELICNTTNLGFGVANNLALETVTTPYALLVNPDAVLTANCTKHLLDAADTFPDAAILAPKLAGAHAETLESFKRNVFRREARRDRFTLPEDTCCAEFLSGAVWFMRMEAFRRIGFFDPEIFLFYEDDDLCMRTRKSGFSLIYVPSAMAEHGVGKSSPNSTTLLFFKQRQMIRGRLYLEQKYFGVSAAQKLALKLQWKNRIRLLGACCILQLRRTVYYRARLSGIQSFLEGRK